MIDYDKFLSHKAKELKPSGIRKFFDIVSEMPEAISLGVGEPDFKTPYFISDEAIKIIKKGVTQYTSNSGLFELREAISQYLKKYDLKYTPNEILVTVGASEAIDLALRAIIEDGDEVLIPDPCYVSYEPCVILSGGVAVGVPCDIQDSFKLTAKALKSVITNKTKAIIFPYPNNPTGAVMERQYLEEIVPLIKKHNLLVITDEIYCELTYGMQHTSIASFEGMQERTIYINGFSKAFAMTGWRLGYCAAPQPLIDAMTKIHQYSIMCAPTMSQYAGYKAILQCFEDNYEVVNKMREQYDQRRKYIVKCFNDLGLTCFEPKGAFYVFPSVASLGLTGEEFSLLLLNSEKVAVVPGIAFGESGKYYIRISYAYSMNSLVTAMSRIERFVKSYIKEKNKEVQYD